MGIAGRGRAMVEKSEMFSRNAEATVLLDGISGKEYNIGNSSVRPVRREQALKRWGFR